MPPKKKNKYANANARGFATTSIPKTKPVVVVPEPEPEPKPEIVPELDPITAADPEDKEPVDEYASLAEKLESLTLKKVDTFLSQSQKVNVETLPVLKMESNLESRVAGLLNENGSKDGVYSTANLVLSQEQWIGKINVTYLSLLRLGFEKQDIENAITHTFTGESDDALDWLCMNLDSERLPRGFADKLYQDDIDMAVTAHTHTTASVGGQSFVHTPSLPPRITNALSLQDIQEPVSSAPTPEKKVDTGHQEGKEWILKALQDNGSDDENQETLDPNEKYVNFKMQLQDLMDNMTNVTKPEDRKALMRKVDTLNSKINDLDIDFAFSKKTAEIMLKNRIADEKKKSQKLKKKKKREQEAAAAAASTADSSTNQPGDGDEADGLGLEFGGLFESEAGQNTPPTTSTTATAKPTIVQRQMANPGWSGGSPKVVLAEYIRKRDKSAKIVYSKAPNSTTTTALAKITVTWATENKSVYEMKEEGCEDKIEAENYVATLALFNLSPLPYYRSLPPTYRDLWLEWIDEKELEGRLAKKAVDHDRISFIKGLTSSVPRRTGGTDKNSAEKGQDVEATLTAESIEQQEAVVTPAGKTLQAFWTKRLGQSQHMKLFEKRKELPMYQFRDQLLALLETKQVVIVSGETGCGKSTQVPQYLAEYMLSKGFGDKCDIVCTQPRRISAISIAHRVSEELGDGRNSAGKPNSLVGYQIRLESKVAPTNVLKFCTTGILLRRLECDKMLKGVTHLVIDEVHERTLESDFLLIILKRLLPVRPDLKVILMSATVDAERFSDYFGSCSVLEVPGRTFPVHPFFLENIIEATGYTLEEDSEYAIRFQRDIQSKGSVDISGKGASRQTVQLRWDGDIDENYQREVEARVTVVDGTEEDAKLAPAGLKPKTYQMLHRMDENRINYDLIHSLLELICFPEDFAKSKTQPDFKVPEEGAILIFLPGMPEIRKLFDGLKSNRRFADESRFTLWPLHSSISSEGQSEVFEIPPPGVRKIVLATNIAETGITIPDVTVVIDTGKQKQVRFDEKRRITSLQERFVARANARQRRGRAGRVQEGVCFHLFSLDTFERVMPEYQLPEIMRMPLEELCLMIKMCELGTIADFLAAALDPPPPKAVGNAIQALQEVGALTVQEELTPLGSHLCNLPVDVHIGKMILFGAIFRCLDPILTIAAMLSYKSPFVTPFGSEDEADAAKGRFKIADSDMLTWYNGYLGWKLAYEQKPSGIYDFCRRNFLSHANLIMIEDMKKQFLGFLVSTGFVKVDANIRQLLGREKFSRKISFCPVVADCDTFATSVPVINAAITAGMFPKVMNRSEAVKAYLAGPKQDTVWIHPSSVNFTKGGVAAGMRADASPWFVYNTLIKSSRMYVWESCRVGQYPLVLFGGAVEVKHHAKLVTVDKWIQFKCHAKTAVVFKLMRKELDKLLQRRIDDPEQKVTKGEEEWLQMMVAMLEAEEEAKPVETKGINHLADREKKQQQQQ